MLFMLTRWPLFSPFYSPLQALHGSRRTEWEAEAEAHPDHVHQRPAEGAGAGFCWNALPGHLHQRRAGSQNRSDWSQSAGTQLPADSRSAPVTRGGTPTAHWRIYNGTILGHCVLNAAAFYCFLVKAFQFGRDAILAPHSHHLIWLFKKEKKKKGLSRIALSSC